MFTLRFENESGNVVNVNDGEKYVVLSVSGLNPPSASIFTAKSPNRKGVKYNGSTIDARNIVVKIKILGDVEENRNALYSWIDTEQYCKVLFGNGVKSVYCEGHIQDCEIDMFTDNEIINLAIICENPYWKDIADISTEIATLLKQFSLAFAIDAIGVPFSTIKSSNTTTIFNAGSETGVKITINCKSQVQNIRLFNANNVSEQFKINYTIPANWIIEIYTDGSPKTVKAIKPDGTVMNMMKYVENNPTWFTLKKGNNAFGFDATSGANNAEVVFSFRNKYLGV